MKEPVVPLFSNPEFTVDEVMSATLAYTEGYAECGTAHKPYRKRYPRLAVGSCVKEALEPIQRAFRYTIGVARHKVQVCPPKDFPPDEKAHGEHTYTYQH